MCCRCRFVVVDGFTFFFFSSRRRHTSCALVTAVQTCALPICLGAGVLGDPARSVSWLVDRLARYGGRIEAGQTVLSGSFIRPIECSPGSHIRADFGTFGGIECRFALADEVDADPTQGGE